MKQNLPFSLVINVMTMIKNIFISSLLFSVTQSDLFTSDLLISSTKMTLLSGSIKPNKDITEDPVSHLCRVAEQSGSHGL